MTLISTRTKLILVGFGYAAILAFGGSALFLRYRYEASHPDEVLASSGMYAAGDTIAAIFFTTLLMIPTFFLIWIGAKFETPYTVYSQIARIGGGSAPVCLALVYFGHEQLPAYLVGFCFARLLWSPFMLAIVGVSRLLARFDRARRCLSHALLSEAATLCTSVVLIVSSMVRA